jgi:hypothetical protein
MLKKITVFIICVGAFVFASANSDEKLFSRTTAPLDKGGVYFMYKKYENLEAQLKQLIDMAAKKKGMTPLQHMLVFNLKYFLTPLKLNDLQAVGVSSKRESMFLYKSNFFAAFKPGSNSALLALPAQRTWEFKFAKNLPVNTVYASGMMLDCRNFYKKLESSSRSKEEFAMHCSMIEQTLNVKIQDLLNALEGEFFTAVYKGKGEEFNFLVSMPDNNGLLKQLAIQYFGTDVKQHPNGSAVLEMPYTLKETNNSIRAVFADKRLYVFNSNADLDLMLNKNGRAGRLAAFNPKIYGFLNKFEGNSYSVFNLDTAWVNRKMWRRIYQAGGYGCFSNDGYLFKSEANFNIFDMSNFLPLYELINKKLEKPVNTALDGNFY